MIKKSTLITSFSFLTAGLLFPATALAAAATLSLSPATGQLNRGCTYPINIILDTGGAETGGTDAYLFYDPAVLTTTTDQITPGTVYPQYSGTVVDPDKKSIKISGLSIPPKTFAGNGVLATINLRVPQDAKLGSTQITFDFDPNNKNKTDDSNVVELSAASEILNAVTNGSYTIGEGSCSNPQKTLPRGAVDATPAAGLNPVPTTPAYKKLPNSGSFEQTAIIAALGTFFVLAGVIGLALL